jgi:hypothetical protein
LLQVQLAVVLCMETRAAPLLVAEAEPHLVNNKQAMTEVAAQVEPNLQGGPEVSMEDWEMVQMD